MLEFPITTRLFELMGCHACEETFDKDAGQVCQKESAVVLDANSTFTAEQVRGYLEQNFKISEGACFYYQPERDFGIYMNDLYFPDGFPCEGETVQEVLEIVRDRIRDANEVYAVFAGVIARVKAIVCDFIVENGGKVFTQAIASSLLVDEKRLISGVIGEVRKKYDFREGEIDRVVADMFPDFGEISNRKIAQKTVYDRTTKWDPLRGAPGLVMKASRRGRSSEREGSLVLEETCYRAEETYVPIWGDDREVVGAFAIAPNLMGVKSLRDAMFSLSEKDRIKVLMDAMKGCAEFHREGFVHRDFKLGNILVFRDRGDVNGEVSGKLADHDLVIEKGKDKGESIRGTPGYLDCFWYSQRHMWVAGFGRDVFAAGMSLFYSYFRTEDSFVDFRLRLMENWGRRREKNRNSLLGFLDRTFYDHSRLLKRYMPVDIEIPEGVWDLIVRMVHRDLEKRPSIQEAVAVLEGEYAF